MEYLALIYADETAWEGFSDDTRNAMYEQYCELYPATRAQVHALAAIQERGREDLGGALPAST